VPGNVEAAPTRPFSKDALSGRSGVASRGNESRLAGVITIFILIATLLLLGFSVYLAAELGFLSIPGVKTQTVSPTAPPDSVLVPNLIGQNYAQTKALAERSGFKLVVMNNVTSGKVIHQSPTWGDYARRGEPIQVQFDGSQTGQTVPTDLAGKSLDDVKQILDKDGILYTVVSDPNDAQDPNQGPNTVMRVDPNQGQPLQSGQQVTLFVTNLGGTTPTPVSTVAPTTVVIEQPTPTPTSIPTPTPKPTPTPTPTPKPTPTPTPIVKPTP